MNELEKIFRRLETVSFLDLPLSEVFSRLEQGYLKGGKPVQPETVKSLIELNLNPKETIPQQPISPTHSSIQKENTLIKPKIPTEHSLTPSTPKSVKPEKKTEENRNNPENNDIIQEAQKPYDDYKNLFDFLKMDGSKFPYRRHGENKEGKK